MQGVVPRAQGDSEGTGNLRSSNGPPRVLLVGVASLGGTPLSPVMTVLSESLSRVMVSEHVTLTPSTGCIFVAENPSSNWPGFSVYVVEGGRQGGTAVGRRGGGGEEAANEVARGPVQLE